MTDRELLELAAKAAGIEINPMEMNNVSMPGDNRFIGFMADPKRCPRGWFNPLSDDGDALRLAVKLGGELRINIEENWSAFGTLYSDEGMFEYHEKDPCAATRRAIVRVAAEIEKRKDK